MILGIKFQGAAPTNSNTCRPLCWTVPAERGSIPGQLNHRTDCRSD